MNPRPLIIGPNETAAIKRIVDYAKTHVLGRDRLIKMSEDMNPADAIGNDLDTRIELPVGYRVVYSIEEQPYHGLCHHISVSVNEENLPEGEVMLPNKLAIDLIMEAFGMGTTVDKALFIYKEDLDYGGRMALNIIEPVERRKE